MADAMQKFLDAIETSQGEFEDRLAKTVQIGQRNREWKERKNIQRQGIMNELARGISTTYDEKQLNTMKKRFQNYYNRHIGDMDEASIEMGSVYLDSFDTQARENKDFEFQERRLKEMQTKMANAFNDLDRMDSSQNPEFAAKAKELNEEWLGYVSDFKKSHGDRLSLKPFQHIDAQLDQGKAMNDFLLESLRDDKYIDDMEYQAFQDSWENLSLDPISTYKQKEAVSNDLVIKSAAKQLIEGVEEYQNLASFIGGTSTMKINEFDTPFKTLSSSEKSSWIAKQDQLEKELKNLDSNYSNKLGKSYLGEMHPNLFKVPTPPPSTTPTPQVGDKDKDESKIVGSEVEVGEKFSVPEDDLSKLKDKLSKIESGAGLERYSRGIILKNPEHKLFKEYNKAKKRDSSITLDDFISNRSDLYTKWKKKDISKTAKQTETKHKVKFRKDVGKLSSGSLKYDIMSGKGYKGAVPIIRYKTLDGKKYAFRFSKNPEDGSLDVVKFPQDKYTGKYSKKSIKSSIGEWES